MTQELKPCPVCEKYLIEPSEDCHPWVHPKNDCLLRDVQVWSARDEAQWQSLPRHTEPEWLPIEQCPSPEQGKELGPYRVKLDSEEYYSLRKSRKCTGMCAPSTQAPHTTHFHNEWVLSTALGEELHPPECYKTIFPEYFLPNPPEVTK